jgi:hypothetical protein
MRRTVLLDSSTQRLGIGVSTGDYRVTKRFDGKGLIGKILPFKGQRWVQAPTPLIADLCKTGVLNFRQAGLYAFVSGLSETGSVSGSTLGVCRFVIREVALREGVSEITVRRDLEELEKCYLIECRGRFKNGVEVYLVPAAIIPSLRSVCAVGMSQINVEQHLEFIEEILMKRCGESRTMSQKMSFIKNRNRLKKQLLNEECHEKNVAPFVSLEKSLEYILEATQCENSPADAGPLPSNPSGIEDDAPEAAEESKCGPSALSTDQESVNAGEGPSRAASEGLRFGSDPVKNFAIIRAQMAAEDFIRSQIVKNSRGGLSAKNDSDRSLEA